MKHEEIFKQSCFLLSLLKAINFLLKGANVGVVCGWEIKWYFDKNNTFFHQGLMIDNS